VGRDTVWYVVLGLAFLGACVVEFALWPQRNQPVVYTIPLLIAALRFPPRVVTATVLIVGSADLIDASIARTPLEFWPLTLLALIVTGYLAIRLAQQRERSRRLAREAQEARDRLQAFLAMVTHDLGGPTFSIVGTAQLLQESLPLASPPEQRRALQIIAGAAQRLRRHIGDLHDASLIGRDQFTVQARSADLMAIARQVVERCQVTTRRHRLRLEGPERLDGCWDPERIDQLLDNLVSNATKYAVDGDVRVTIAPADPEVVIGVADRGPGIAPADQARLFDPFVRLAPGAHKGMGLGLHIAKAIAEAHQGRIGVESTLGSGSHFWVALPCAPQPTPEPVRSGVSGDLGREEHGRPASTRGEAT
jgi:signal transduction histidine kinase